MSAKVSRELETDPTDTGTLYVKSPQFSCTQNGFSFMSPRLRWLSALLLKELMTKEHNSMKKKTNTS